MKRQLHNSDDVFISPQQGWEQMQLLLDKRLPVKNKKPLRGFYFPMMVAASLITIFLSSILVLNDTAIINSNKPEADKSNAHKGSIIAYSMNATDGKTGSRSVIKNEQTGVAVVSSESNDLTFRKIALPENIHPITYLPINALPVENIIAKMAMIAIPQDAVDEDSAGLAEKAGKLHQMRHWQLSAGLAMNTMIGQQQNFTPYPAAVLRYDLSKNFFLSLGLSAGSHIAGESRGLKKKTYVNDMVNNIQFYNTVNQYYDFSYADIPLLAGVHISKKISLQAGLQASVLLKTKTKTIIEQYDFQMRLAGGATNGLVSGTAAAPVSETDYRVEARKMDYRFTTGIKYNINKLAFNVMYQHSLQPALTGDFTSGNKHQLVTLNMQFNIK